MKPLNMHIKAWQRKREETNEHNYCYDDRFGLTKKKMLDVRISMCEYLLRVYRSITLKLDVRQQFF